MERMNKLGSSADEIWDKKIQLYEVFVYQLKCVLLLYLQDIKWKFYQTCTIKTSSVMKNIVCFETCPRFELS